MNDKTRTNVSNLENEKIYKNGSKKWIDRMIPDGSVIAGGEVLVKKADGMLLGLKFWD